MKDLFVFDLGSMSTWSRRYWTSGTVPTMPFTKFARMTGISTSCDEKHRRLTGLGIWCHSGNCHENQVSKLMVVSVDLLRQFGSGTRRQSSSGNMNVITGSPSSPGPETAFSLTNLIPAGPLLAVASTRSFGHSAESATMQ